MTPTAAITPARLRAIALAVLASLGGAAAQADTSSGALTLVKFELSPLDQGDQLTVTNNACVEAVAKSDIAAARIQCNAALRAARVERGDPMFVAYSSSPGQNLAIAYNNRAVLEHLMGDAAAARADIDHAMSLGGLEPSIKETYAHILAGGSSGIRVAQKGSGL